MDDWARGEYKVPGGKLVAVSVAIGTAACTCPIGPVDSAVHTDVRHQDVRVDGDFFVDPADDAPALLADIARALAAGEPAQAALDRHSGVRLVGIDAAAIDTAYARALAAAAGSNPAAATSHRTQPDHPHPSHGLPADAPAGGDALAAAGEDSEFARRWERLGHDLVVVHDAPREPAEQMALDKRWAREVAAGLRPPTLRLWEWASPCVVIGRFQSLPDEVHEAAARAEGFAVVRRCTGGGAMVVRPQHTITYSLYVPAWFVGGLDARAAYRLCDRPIVRALADLGIAVGFSGLNDIASPLGKIGGAAQRRFPAPPSSPAQADPRRPAGGATLHHTTLAYDFDADLMARLLNTSPEKLADKAVRSARRRVDPLRRQTDLTRGQVVAHLLAAMPGHRA